MPKKEDLSIIESSGKFRKIEVGGIFGDDNFKTDSMGEYNSSTMAFNN